MTKGFLRALPRAWWLGAALLLKPIAAHAEEEARPYPECGRDPSDSDVTAAKAAFQAGNVSFNEADYPRAILYWEDAYRRDCSKHQMLLNLARAYELNGNRKQAVMALETFVAREPNAPDKPQITRRIEVIKKQIDSEEAAAAQQQPATTEPSPQDQATQPTTPTPASNEPPPGEEGSRPIAPLIVVGVGGALLIGGTVLGVVSASDVDEFASHCDNPEQRTGCPDDEVDDANSARNRQTMGVVIAGIGGAAVVGGLIWYFVSPREPASAALSKPRTVMLPTVAPGFTGLSLSGSF
jgi:tetratricopeptide (TPR) repeat protein